MTMLVVSTTSVLPVLTRPQDKHVSVQEDLTDFDDSNFVELATVNNGIENKKFSQRLRFPSRSSRKENLR